MEHIRLTLGPLLYTVSILCTVLAHSPLPLMFLTRHKKVFLVSLERKGRKEIYCNLVFQVFGCYNMLDSEHYAKETSGGHCAHCGLGPSLPNRKQLNERHDIPAAPHPPLDLFTVKSVKDQCKHIYTHWPK